MQIPDDANWAHVLRPTQVKDLLDDLIGCLVRVIVRAAPATRESSFAELAVPVSPEIEGRSRDSEAAACRIDVAELLRVLEDSLLTSDFSLIFGPLDPLGQPLPSSWQGVGLDL